MHQRKLLIKKGAEADIYLIDWYGRKAISKVRTPKPYRHKSLDDSIRKNRTIHEGNMLSCAKMIGIRSPFIYFIDPVRAEIVMEFIEGKNAKEMMTHDFTYGLDVMQDYFILIISFMATLQRQILSSEKN